MPWCPVCRTEYEASVPACTDCGAELVDTLSPAEPTAAPVVVLEADTGEEATIAAATLNAAGVPAFVGPDDPVIPAHSNMVDDDPALVVMVPAQSVDEAKRVLAEAPMSEEELVEAQREAEGEPVADDVA
ncbi:MAG: hypothetical protein IT208_16630 [Chthonomonadales bacterium]|nr:hypothetical protein [Chthonomonadales bacterium]